MTPCNNPPDEVWQQYKDTYWIVSNLGGAKHQKNPFRKPWLGSNGYQKVTIRESISKWSELYLHRMIAETFVKGDQSLTVNHIDGNKLNNASSNLEFITNESNVSHAHEIGIYDGQLGEGNHWAKLTEQDIHKVCSMLDDGFSQSDIAKTFNVDPSNISLINSGKRWSSVTNRKTISK